MLSPINTVANFPDRMKILLAFQDQDEVVGNIYDEEFIGAWRSANRNGSVEVIKGMNGQGHNGYKEEFWERLPGFLQEVYDHIIDDTVV